MRRRRWPEIGDNGNGDGPRSGDHWQRSAKPRKRPKSWLEKTGRSHRRQDLHIKVQLVDYSTQLMGERTALVDRLKLVLDKLEAKGGDGKPYRLYIASIGGIKIDVSDRTATLARISGWLSSEEGGLRLARNVGTFFTCIIGSIIVAGIVRMILRRVMDEGPRDLEICCRDFIISYTGRVIVAIGFLLALSALEVNLAPLLAVIGAAGFVVAFALQGTLSNFASGLAYHGRSSRSTSAMKSKSAAASRAR